MKLTKSRIRKMTGGQKRALAKLALRQQQERAAVARFKSVESLRELVFAHMAVMMIERDIAEPNSLLLRKAAEEVMVDFPGIRWEVSRLKDGRDGFVVLDY